MASNFAEIHVDELPAHAEAGAVDQDVEVAELVEELAVGALDVFLAPDVGLDRVRRNGLRRLFQPAFVAARNRDARSGLGQRLCDGEPDAARAAGDERRCVLEIHFAANPSLRNAMSGGYVFSGASKCGTCPSPGIRCSLPLPLGIVSAMNFIRS